MFEVRLATTAYTPPHSVTMRTPANDWVDIAGEYRDGSWVFQLDENGLWSDPGYFKFVLDDRFWMDDPYIRIAPNTGATYNFDEARVTFPMATALSTAPTPAVTAPPQPAGLPFDLTQPISEGAVINRVVVLATPVVTIGAAWVAGIVARHVPGVKLDQTQVVSVMIAVIAVCLAAAWKWLHGWQQHELLVAQKLAAPIKPVIPTGGQG
jgi:hypothetical protein